METGILSIILTLLIGLVLLFFGLKFMKLAVTLMGFVIGYAITPSLLAGFALAEPTIFVLSLVVAIVCAILAFSFYKFAITATIALFFFYFTYEFAQSLNQVASVSWIFALMVGVLAFIVVAALKLVDVFFALTTAAQGSNLLMTLAYSFFGAASPVLAQGFNFAAAGAYTWLWLLGWILLTAIGFVFQLSGHREKSEPIV